MEAETLENILIKRGVGQVCDLFNVYSKLIFQEVLEVNEGIKMNGECINNIRCANDSVVSANNRSNLQ